MLTVLLSQFNPVIACDIFTCVVQSVTELPQLPYKCVKYLEEQSQLFNSPNLKVNHNS